MKTFKLLFLISIFVGLITGCSKDEVTTNELEDVALKSAASKPEMITITRTTPNGKEITIEVPASAVEALIEQSPRLPYSPEGVYVFYDKKLDRYYDFFITVFDGSEFKGTYGYPAGGPYEITGEIVGGAGMVMMCTAYRGFISYFIVDGQKQNSFKFLTTESDGIFRDFDFSDIIKVGDPYSPEGVYEVCEYLNDDVIKSFILFITLVEGKEIKGEYEHVPSYPCKVQPLSGFIGASKDGVAPVTINLYESDKLQYTITGYVDYSNGLIDFDEPFGFPPPVIVLP